MYKKKTYNILSDFKHEDLFALAGFPVSEDFICNPLRKELKGDKKDNNPGCFYNWYGNDGYKTLYFYDFTGFFGKAGVHAVDLLKITTEIEDEHRLYYWVRYKIENKDFVVPDVPEREYNSNVEIDWEPKPWENYNYFSKYKIPKDVLEPEGVFNIGSYSANTRRNVNKIENLIGNPHYSPIIAYKFKERTKLYNPYGHIKWFGNITAEDVWGFDSFNKESNYCIITKSAKDFLVIKYVLGYECIAIQNEGMNCPKKVLNVLDSKKVFTIFDTDEAGIRNAKKYKQKYKHEPLYLPGKLSDTSEIVHIKGVKHAKEIYKNFKIERNGTSKKF